MTFTQQEGISTTYDDQSGSMLDGNQSTDVHSQTERINPLPAPLLGDRSLNDVLTIEGFEGFYGVFKGAMTDVLLRTAFASHGPINDHVPPNVIVTKNLIVILQALCLLQDVWPPPAASRKQKQAAFHELEKMVDCLFDPTMGNGGSLALGIVRMYAKARKNACDFQASCGILAYSTDPLVALLQELVDEWIRLEGTGVPHHPLSPVNTVDSRELLAVRHSQWESFMCNSLKRRMLFSTMWFWVPEDNRCRSLPLSRLLFVVNRNG